MESWPCFCWIYLWTAIVSADPTYIVHHTELSFDEAMDRCSPAFLTTLATQQEVSDILMSVSTTISPVQHKFTFWVGLKKLKNECIVPSLSLRGFKWTDNGSEETQMSRWREEPKHTCTTVRCAAMTGEFNGLSVTDWGLIPVSCKNRYQFICKQRDRQMGGPPEPKEPENESAAPEPEPKKPESENVAPEPEPKKNETESAAPEPEPKKAETESAAPEPKKPKSESAAPDLSTPASVTSEPKHPTPEPEDELKTDISLGPDLKPRSGSGSCVNPVIDGSRFLTTDHNNSSRMGVDCFSGVRLQLYCLDGIWWLMDSPLNTTSACQPCDAGFNKDFSGNCVDVDECRVHPAPCRHTCLNTEGSFRCVCSDSDGKHYDEGSAECKNALSGILIPVLVAVAALVVLVVVVVVMVKCCLMKRSKKRAMKKAEKMAMKSKNGKESYETANERIVA